MKNNNSLIVFSIALVLGAAMISGTLLYTGKSSTAEGRLGCNGNRGSYFSIR